MNMEKRHLLLEKQNEILDILQTRFTHHMDRHPRLDWERVKSLLLASQEKLRTLYEMEITGGEPDLIQFSDKEDKYTFFDCSAESPKGRRSVCYDRDALDGRKEHKPTNDALDMALEIGIDLLTEEQYRMLQTFGPFDIKTSSWVKTPSHIRKLGGALFCDCRYDTVFVYHNGAESYYGVRGFRGLVTI